MTFNTPPALFALIALLSPLPAMARLGETEAQSQARYGEPAPQFASPVDRPIMSGSKEVIYHFGGWRIRVAFVNNVALRLEYVHLPEGSTPKPISEAELKTILDAEKATFSWREQKPKTGNKDLNALKTFFDGRSWERGDHATATLKASLLLVIETRDADSIEKKLAKQVAPNAGGTPNAPAVPKF